MVVIPKKNGTLRICPDPKPLNCHIQRENYQLSTVEDIAKRLDKAKLFTVLDARSGFWHVHLDTPSSLLTTFHTPLADTGGSECPLAYHQHQRFSRKGCTNSLKDWRELKWWLIFVVIGFGDTMEEAAASHDNNLKGLLNRCEQHDVKLNYKVQFKQDKVPFIGQRGLMH